MSEQVTPTDEDREKARSVICGDCPNSLPVSGPLQIRCTNCKRQEARFSVAQALAERGAAEREKWWKAGQERMKNRAADECSQVCHEDDCHGRISLLPVDSLPEPGIIDQSASKEGQGQ